MSFGEILTRKRDEVTEPKAVPTGTWELEVVAMKAIEPDSGDAVVVTYLPKSPGADVAEEELTEAGDTVYETPVFHRIFMNRYTSEWDLWQFIALHGIDKGNLELPQVLTGGPAEVDGISIGPYEGQIKGTRVKAEVFRAFSDDGKDVYTNLQAFTSIDA